MIKKTQSYVDKKSNKKGFLSVTHQGFTSYYSLKRDYNNPSVKRLLNNTPVKHVWFPIKTILKIPKYYFHLIKHEGFFRSFRAFGFAFQELMYHFNPKSYDEFSSNYFGYMVLNKPKYLPNDTVKFKAYIVNRKGKALNKPVNVVLGHYRDRKILTKLNPYTQGGYECQFVFARFIEIKARLFL